jgi:hypothetical protein
MVLNDVYWVELDLKGEKTAMNAAQIKDEIRKLNRTDKIEIYSWLDKEAAEGLYCRIGTYRSLAIRQEIERECKGTNPERGAHLGDAARESINYPDQSSPVANEASGNVRRLKALF